MFESKEYLAVVIAVEGKPRNRELVRQISEFLPGVKVSIVDAMTPDFMSPKEISYYTIQNRFLFRRNVTETEIAVLLSHKLAYEVGSKAVTRGLFVFEDDIWIPEGARFKFNEISKFKKTKPYILSLFSPKWAVWFSLGERNIALFPPAYAAAYYISLSTINFVLRQKIYLGLADWPSWAFKVKFYFEGKYGLSLINSNSYLEEKRLNSKSSQQGKFKVLLEGFKKSEIGFFPRLVHIYVWPIIWKVLSRGKSKSVFIKLFSK
jgi:Glycosyltransferase family 25 (LPS biosynthesis protein)